MKQWKRNKETREAAEKKKNRFGDDLFNKGATNSVKFEAERKLGKDYVSEKGKVEVEGRGHIPLIYIV